MTVDSTYFASLLTSITAIVVALIGAWSVSGRAVAAAVAPKDKTIEELRDHIAEQGVMIQRLREKILELRGDPDEP